MSRPSVLSAARQLLRRQFADQKVAYLAVLGRQWGAAYAEQVARKADFMSPKPSAVDVRLTGGER